MNTRFFPAAVAVLLIAGSAGTALVTGTASRPQADAVPAEQLQAALTNLGRLEYDLRMNAARTIRRTPAATAVPALLQAATEHADGFVRFRALVLLAGFNDPRTGDLMHQLLADPNDRLRQVAFNYFEHAPDASMAPALLKAAQREESEFVRPSLIRALAAIGSDPKVRERLTADADRGMDFFRSEVIEALGDYKASYALPALTRIAQLDGPLQDDAVLALGKIGDKRALETVVALQRTAPRNLQPAIAAAICLLGVNCASHERYLEETLRFGLQNPEFQELLRAAASGMGAIASTRDAQALASLLDIGIAANDPGRAPIALALGAVAVRNTPVLLAALEKREDVDAAVSLLSEAFDMLEEDFEEELFFVTVRRTYWQAPEGSQTRAVTQALIEKLNF